MNYDAAVNFLYGLQKHGIKLGLANARELMRILDQPQQTFRSVHIAGTNGKGSTASMLASILMENNKNVGLFTSPHLVSFTERISINNQRIRESDVITLTSRIRSMTEGSDLSPTFFEFITALAFYHFALNSVDWAVIETGMGGRLDATNVLKPEIAIITNVSRDHSEFLGGNISQIAAEKAGIIKAQTPVVTASKNSDALKIISRTASDRNSELHVYEREFKGTILGMDDERIIFSYEGYRTYEHLFIPLIGEFQMDNACLAIRACEILRKQGVPISDDSIREGLSKVRIEGRLEQVSKVPPIFLDGAHNPAAARALAKTIKRHFPDKKIILIAGIMYDKDFHDILSPLVKCARSVILTRANYDRAAAPSKLRESVLSMLNSDISDQPKSIQTADSVAEALDVARSLCEKDHVILVTGSFYTTGEAKEILGHKGVLSRLREHL